MWNFKGTLWNSTQNILPIHWKIWLLYNIEILRALRFKSSYAPWYRQAIFDSKGHVVFLCWMQDLCNITVKWICTSCNYILMWVSCYSRLQLGHHLSYIADLWCNLIQVCRYIYASINCEIIWTNAGMHFIGPLSGTTLNEISIDIPFSYSKKFG